MFLSNTFIMLTAIIVNSTNILNIKRTWNNDHKMANEEDTEA